MQITFINQVKTYTPQSLILHLGPITNKINYDMDRFTLPKQTTFSYFDTRFYQPVSRMHTSQTAYEEVRGNQQQNTFRKKKVSDCHNLNYSSCLNPFARAKNVRYDQTNKQFDKKKPVPFRSNIPTDPVTLRYEPFPKAIRTKPEFTSSFQYRGEVERKYLLPAQREISESKRRYFSNIGMTSSLQKLPRTRETQDSSRIKPVLEYAEANHNIQEITPKVGQTRVKKQ